MRPFVDAMSRAGVIKVDVVAFLRDRDERFRDGNDKTWGAGQWERCGTCLDTLGYPAYHHKEHHS